MKHPSLSICIPTYNFGRFIGETLDSIVPQTTDEAEIVILDGGSIDNTREVVGSFMNKTDRIRYVRQEAKGGIDRDMARCVELASGEYCWLFSADDAMEEGAIDAVLNQIREGLDLYLCDMTLCTLDMRPLRPHPVLDARPGSVFDLSVLKEREDYFARAETTTAFFSFCGSLVFRKSRWDAIPLDEDFVGSCWAHVARFFRMIPQGLRVKYLAGSYVHKREGNDSFLDRGRVHRIGIAVDGYHRLAATFFGENSREAAHIRRVLRNEYPLSDLLYTKLMAHEARGSEDLGELDRLVSKLYCDLVPPDLLKLLFYRATPVFALRLAGKISRRYRLLGRRP